MSFSLTERGESVANSAIQLLGYITRFAKKTRPDLPDWPEGVVTFHKRKSRRKDGMGVGDFAAWWKQAQTAIRSEIRRQMMLFELLSGLRGNDVRMAKHEHIKEGLPSLPRVAFRAPADPPVFAACRFLQWLPVPVK